MIEPLHISHQKELFNVLDFLAENDDLDFYFTEDNARIYITDIISLKKMLRNSISALTIKEKGDCVGVIMVWKSLGGGKVRYYVKVNAKNNSVCLKLLTGLLWNFNKELFVKIRKDNKLISVFKYKGFRFVGGRGLQTLLRKEPGPKDNITLIKKEEENAGRIRYQHVS